MSRISWSTGTLSLCLFVLAADAPRLSAQQQQTDQPQARSTDDAKSGPIVRASQFTKLKIQDQQGSSLGSVDDFVIDCASGQIRYVAVSYGGVLGLGSELHAVPWAAFEFRPAEGERGEYTLVLNVSEEKIKGAEGFDKKNWPDFADPQFTRGLDAHYEVTLQGTEAQRGAAQRSEQGVTGSEGSASGPMLRASELIQMTIHNRAGENLGTADDCVIDTKAGKVRYMVVSYDGIEGAEDKLFAVPWAVLECKPATENDDEYQLVLSASEQVIKGAEGFDRDNWSDFADPQVMQAVDRHYGAARPGTDR